MNHPTGGRRSQVQKKRSRWLIGGLIGSGLCLVLLAGVLWGTTQYNHWARVRAYRAYAAQMAASATQTPGAQATLPPSVVIRDGDDDLLPGPHSQTASPGEPAQTLPAPQETPDPPAKQATAAPPQNLIGLIDIPRIDLVAAVAQGVDNQTIKYAVGHFDDTSMPGEGGNVALIGHRNYTFGQFFNRLDELEKGDAIFIEHGTMRYEYMVTDKFVVEPDAMWVLDSGEEEQVTLITCTPIRVATHRLIVRGRLVAAAAV